jgi:hypothetical protein
MIYTCLSVTELMPLLSDRGVALSASQVHRLVSDTPELLSRRCRPRSATSFVGNG